MTITSTAPVQRRCVSPCRQLSSGDSGDDSISQDARPLDSLHCGVRDEMMSRSVLRSFPNDERTARRPHVRGDSVTHARRPAPAQVLRQRRPVTVPPDSQLDHVRLRHVLDYHLGTFRRRDHARGPRWRRVSQSVSLRPHFHARHGHLTAPLRQPDAPAKRDGRRSRGQAAARADSLESPILVASELHARVSSRGRSDAGAIWAASAGRCRSYPRASSRRNGVMSSGSAPDVGSARGAIDRRSRNPPASAAGVVRKARIPLR